MSKTNEKNNDDFIQKIISDVAKNQTEIEDLKNDFKKIESRTKSNAELSKNVGELIDCVDSLTTVVDNKQNMLTAGTGITIENNVISSTGGNVTLDIAPTENSQNAVTSGGVYSALLGKQNTLVAGENITIQNGTISANVDTTTLATKTDLTQKQDVLTAGDNISINNGVISATNTTYTAGTGIDITNGVISSTASGLSSVTASDVDSQNATQGQVLTADGNGGASWESASGGTGGMTQEQETQLSTVYDYYITHHIEQDPYYSGETFVDYPEGTIFQIADSYVREYSYTSNSSLTFPSVYFSAEANSVGTISVIFDYKVLNVATNILVQINLNGTSICSQIETVEQADTKYIFNKIVTTDLSSTGKNKLDITISLQGSSSSSRTLIVEKITTSFSAPNVVVLNKLCPFDVINIDGTYYIADCTGETVKTAIIAQNNMFNINSLTWNNTNISANSFKFYPKLSLYDNVYQTSAIGYLYQNKLENFFSCIDSLNVSLAFPTNFICSDFTTQKSENVSFMSCRTNANNMIRYNHIISSNSYSETNGGAGTGYCGKLIGARNLGNYSLRASIPNCMIRIDQGGEATVHGAISGTYGKFSLGKAQDATMYLKNITHNGKYDVECYVKKFDKIVKYDLSYASKTFTLNSKTVMGYYDKFFKMNDIDYFVVKNNQLQFYRIEQE